MRLALTSAICAQETDVVDLLHAYSKHCDGRGPAELAVQAAQSRRVRSVTQRSGTARQLRAAQVDDLVAHYQEVRNVAEVARHFGVTRQTVGAHLASRGIQTVRRMSEADISTAAALYREGRSAAIIGRRLGFDPQTVLNGLRSVEVPIRARPGRDRQGPR
ncbi:helix-turn-helix domain-containing protein [Microbacterium sp. SORGH_AS_0888]|uniref:helix-turn-helix domain-containing protein n=2 Tax=unclassified Microbacterium TaxID=2609290 RepID=UPI0027853C34|nr:helix-turn-helix domain-containing protein [Microbacterium sp. SORGH_AS_0888]MDQ1131217.1 DNA-binding CsgD family transcriptional regulator [Microbacterium sp. SORGH_AS_0888]